MEKEIKTATEVQEKMSMEKAQEKIQEMQAEGKLNKPTEEEILESAKKLEQAKKDFGEKLFDIGTAEVADEIYDFMLTFLEKHVYWTKNGWMGVIRMYDELSEAKKNKKDGDTFGVGYQALEFMFYALTNPGGTGLESAREIEKVADFYADLIEMTGEKLEQSRKELKDIQFLGDKLLAMQQGFYLEREDGVASLEDSEPETAFASPSADDLLKKK